MHIMSVCDLVLRIYEAFTHESIKYSFGAFLSSLLLLLIPLRCGGSLKTWKNINTFRWGEVLMVTLKKNLKNHPSFASLRFYSPLSITTCLWSSHAFGKFSWLPFSCLFIAENTSCYSISITLRFPSIVHTEAERRREWSATTAQWEWRLYWQRLYWYQN